MTANAADYASLTGHQFSISERAAIQASTPTLLTGTKQNRTKLWGKVYGFKNDYLVVQTIGVAALSTCLTFYSTDGGLQWHLLEPNTADRNELCKGIQGAYMGDAAYEYRVEKDGNAIGVKESERLAFLVKAHDNSCRVIPRGSQLQHEDGTIRLNATFEGLDRAAAGKLSSYVHVREERRDVPALENEGVSTRVDFLDSLAEDVPRGVWNLKYDPILDVVYGQSQVFVGAVFFHQPESNLFGNVYLGDGNVNQDYPFML